jgi:hypothetical protein
MARVWLPHVPDNNAGYQGVRTAYHIAAITGGANPGCELAKHASDKYDSVLKSVSGASFRMQKAAGKTDGQDLKLERLLLFRVTI